MLVPDNLVHLPAAKLPDDAAGRNTPQIPDMKTDDVRKINQSRHCVFPFQAKQSEELYATTALHSLFIFYILEHEIALLILYSYTIIRTPLSTSS